MKLKKWKIQYDVLILLFLVISVSAGWIMNLQPKEMFKFSKELEQVYSAKQKGDELYILDQGHERLLHVDKEGTILKYIYNPFDDLSGSLYIDDYMIDEEGYVYIHASEWVGMDIGREAIIRYSPDFKEQETVASYEYYDNPITKHRIFGLSRQSDQLCYALCDENSISFMQTDLNDIETPSREIYKVSYLNAFNTVADLQIFDQYMMVLAKNGEIQKITEDGKGVLYSTESESSEKYRVPYRFGVTERGEVYFVDLKSGEICQVKEDQTSSVVVSDTESSTVTVSETEGGVNLLYCENNKVSVLYPDGTIEAYEVLQKNSHDVAIQIAIIIWMIVFFVCVCFLLCRYLWKMRNIKVTRMFKITIGAIALTGAVAVLLITMMLDQFANQYRDDIINQLEMAAYTVAGNITGDDIQSINTASDFTSPQYQKLCRVMEQSFDNEIEFYDQIYCNIIKHEKSSGLSYAIAYLDQTIGTYYPLSEKEVKEIQKVCDTRQCVWNYSEADVSGTYIYVKVPVFSENGTVEGAVDVGITTYLLEDMITQMKRTIFSAMIVVLLLIALFLSEGGSFLTSYEKYHQKIARGENAFPGHMFRLLVFAIFVAYNMTASFLPVYIMKYANGIKGADLELAASIPVTINIFIVGVMSLPCAAMLRRVGLAKLAMFSGLCSIAGNCVIFFAPSYPAILLGLILDGIGVGILSNVSYIIITYIQNEEDRMEGFTIYNGACLSGINFGIMLGSVLAVKLGRQNVFGVVAGVWICVVILLVIISKKLLAFAKISKKEVQKSVRGTISFGRFITNGRVFGFMLLIQNMYIVFNSFTDYYLPIFCDAQGYGETTVSLLLMLYSEIAVLLGDKLTKTTSKYLKDNAMYVAIGMNIVTMLFFALTNSMLGMVISVIVLGFATAFAKPVQQNYFMKLNRVKQYGEDNAMGVYNFTENIGQSLGPIIFGKMMSAVPLLPAVGVFTSVVTAAGAIHKVFFQREGKKRKA